MKSVEPGHTHSKKLLARVVEGSAPQFLVCPYSYLLLASRSHTTIEGPACVCHDACIPSWACFCTWLHVSRVERVLRDKRVSAFHGLCRDLNSNSVS